MTDLIIGDILIANDDWIHPLYTGGMEGQYEINLEKNKGTWLYKMESQSFTVQKNDEIKIAGMGIEITTGKEAYLIKHMGNSTSFSIVEKTHIFNYYNRVSHSVSLAFSVPKSTGSMYSSDCPCPKCGNPGYQPFIGNFECSKGCS